jgi:hypothetical protein
MSKFKFQMSKLKAKYKKLLSAFFDCFSLGSGLNLRHFGFFGAASPAVKLGKHINHFLSLVKTASRANHMRLDRFSAFGTRQQIGLFQKQMHPALIPAPLCVSLFWYATHSNR